MAFEDAIAAGRAGRAAVRTASSLCGHVRESYDGVASALARPPPSVLVGPMTESLQLLHDYVQLVSAGFMRAALRLSQDVVAPLDQAQLDQKAVHRQQVKFAHTLINTLRAASQQYKTSETAARDGPSQASAMSEALAQAQRRLRKQTQAHAAGIQQVCDALAAAERERCRTMAASVRCFVEVERERLDSLTVCLDTLLSTVEHEEAELGLTPVPPPPVGTAPGVVSGVVGAVVEDIVESVVAAAGGGEGPPPSDAPVMPPSLPDDGGDGGERSQAALLQGVVSRWFLPRAESSTLPPGSDVEWFREAFSTGEGRRAFVAALNDQRCHQTEFVWGLEDCAAVVAVLLDQCHKLNDTDTALRMMLMAETFSMPVAVASSPPRAATPPPGALREGVSLPTPLRIESALTAAPSSPSTPHSTAVEVSPPGTPVTPMLPFQDVFGTRSRRKQRGRPLPAPPDGGEEREPHVYLRALVCGHPVWSDLGFWKEAFFASIARDTKARHCAPEADLSPDSMSDQKNTIFGHLASFSVSLMSFGVPYFHMTRMVKELCEVYQLSKSQRQMLLQSLTDASSSPSP